ncbi:MAG: hypothetical protein AAGE65_14770 [Planctomycetota bacterium]
MRAKLLGIAYVALVALSPNASGENVIGEAHTSGDLSALNPPTLRGRVINPDDPWKGLHRRYWSGALDRYRKWEASLPARRHKDRAPDPTPTDSPTPVPLPSAALGGLALLGGVCGARVMHRPRSA